MVAGRRHGDLLHLRKGKSISRAPPSMNFVAPMGIELFANTAPAEGDNRDRGEGGSGGGVLAPESGRESKGGAPR